MECSWNLVRNVCDGDIHVGFHYQSFVEEVITRQNVRPLSLIYFFIGL